MVTKKSYAKWKKENPEAYKASCEKLKEAGKRRVWTPEVKQRISEGNKKAWEKMSDSKKQGIYKDISKSLKKWHKENRRIVFQSVGFDFKKLSQSNQRYVTHLIEELKRLGFDPRMGLSEK